VKSEIAEARMAFSVAEVDDAVASVSRRCRVMASSRSRYPVFSIVDRASSRRCEGSSDLRV
jgi:hypothetical protein